MCLISKRLGLAPGGPEDDDGVPAFLAKAMSAPHAKSVSNALELLVNLGAMYPETNQLTALGQCLSVLSLEPRVGKMVIWSYVLGCARVASNMAVAMSFKSPFVLPLESSRRAAQQSLVALSENSESDQITIHNVLETIDNFRSSPGQFHEFCRNNFISANTIQMMADSRVNLSKELASLGFPNPSLRNQYHNRHDNDDALWHAAIAAGLYPNTATRKIGEVNFSTMTNQKLKIHPSSVNAVKGQRLSAKCQVSTGEIEFVCYGEMLKGEQLSTASQTTRLQSPLPILLLCGSSLRVQPHPTIQGEAILNLDDWVVFKCDATLASHIVVLRKRLHSAFWSTIKEPSHVPKLSEEESNAVEILGTILRSAQIITSCPI
jgi:Helicase associated domain (HA2)/Oligonucleotide/oligosaccharide-binding (OB)-fold